MSAFSGVNGIIYLFGGEISPTAGGYSLSLAYDPARDKFTAMRNLPMKCEAAAAATIDGLIYHTGGASGDPGNYPGAVYYDRLWVFDPSGGVFPRLRSVVPAGRTSVRLNWQGEAGLRYSIQLTTDVASGNWATSLFSTGTNAILATNDMVEATVSVPASDAQRFFRALEAE
jgi:hypothetical protein